MDTLTGKVISVKRLGATVSGNPMHEVTLKLYPPFHGEQVETRRVMNDAGINYGINNREYRDKWHEFTLTRAGRIRSARPMLRIQQ